MDKEKQIEEMAKVTMKHCKIDNQCGSCHWSTCNECLADVLYNAGYRKIPDNIGEFSDGYHTFNELYHHRAILFSVICNGLPDNAWKSKLHDTGDMFDGMFIVGIETPEGQATYHYDIEPYWDMFNVKELEKAPKWDGHTPQVAIERIAKLNIGVMRLWENLLKAEAQEVPIKAERIRVAREIFEDLQGLLVMRIGVNRAIAELKNKYTESENNNE